MILGNCSKILIRLGQGCQTGCNGCNEKNKKREYFDTASLSGAITQASHVFSSDVRFFLFGQDPLLSENIEEMLDVIRSVNQNEICIHIADIAMYNGKTYDRLQRILKNHYKLGFYVSTSVTTMKKWQEKDIVRLCRVLGEHEQYPQVQIYYDHLEDLKIPNMALMHHLLPPSHISGTQNIVIDHNGKSVSDHDTKCKFYNTIDIHPDTVDFSPPRLDDFEFEVTYDGDIIPHTPRCYMARIHISNVFLDGSVIREHFILFRDYIYTTNTKHASFVENCYDCIFGANSFDYRKLGK